MSRASEAGNSVVKAAEQACALHGVPSYRMQSRVMTVVGMGGKERPMFFGGWTDDDGTQYKGGMTDLLATPTVRFNCSGGGWPTISFAATTPLWIECKAGSGELTHDQIKFRDHVLRNGASHMLLRDCADELITWFVTHGVKRETNR